MLQSQPGALSRPAPLVFDTKLLWRDFRFVPNRRREQRALQNRAEGARPESAFDADGPPTVITIFLGVWRQDVLKPRLHDVRDRLDRSVLFLYRAGSVPCNTASGHMRPTRLMLERSDVSLDGLPTSGKRESPKKCVGLNSAKKIVC